MFVHPRGCGIGNHRTRQFGAATACRPAIERLNKEIAAALADPTIKARFAALGGTVFALSPGEFGKLLADETAKWGKVVRAANIRLE